MNPNATRLSGITKDLWNQWQETKQDWRDAKCQEFEHKYLQELLSSVEKASAVIEQLEKVVTKLRKDCE